MKRATRLLALALALASTTACPVENDGHVCEQFCELAVRCGILPSPLGAGDDAAAQKKSCGARCRLSDEPSFRAVTSCLPSAPGDASVDDLWCSSMRPACAALESCLAETFPEADVTGLAPLEVGLSSSDAPGTVKACATLLQAVSTPLSCGADADPLALQAITVTVSQRSFQKRLPALACPVAAASAIPASGLHAGPVQVAAEVTATGAGLPGRLCRRFEASGLVLLAGKQNTARVAVPTTPGGFLAGGLCAVASAADGGPRDGAVAPTSESDARLTDGADATASKD